MTSIVSNNRKMILSGAAVLAFGVAAYGLGRVYPPLGPSEGTVAPADRYVSSQVTEADVTLGDTAVPELMQTDAFELMVHDANFRALAESPGFQALAGQPQVMAALMSNPQAFAALAKDRNAFAGVAQAAHNASALAPQAHQASAALMNAVAGASAGDAGACLASAGASRDRCQSGGFRQLRVQRQRLPRRCVQGRGRCAHGQQCRRFRSGSQATTMRCRRSPRIRACSARSLPMRHPGRPWPASRRRSPLRSTALLRPLTSCNRPGYRTPRIAAIAGQQRGVRGAPVAAAGDGGDRVPLESVCGARRASSGIGRDLGQCHRPSAASANNANAFRNAALEGRGGRAPGAQRSGVPKPRQRQAMRWRRSPPIRRCSPRSPTTRSPSASLASNAHMMSPQAGRGDRQQRLGLLEHGQQCGADQRCVEGAAGADAHSLAASAAAAGQDQRQRVAGGACQPASVRGDDGQSAGVRGGRARAARRWRRLSSNQKAWAAIAAQPNWRR